MKQILTLVLLIMSFSLMAQDTLITEDGQILKLVEGVTFKPGVVKQENTPKYYYKAVKYDSIEVKYMGQELSMMWECVASPAMVLSSSPPQYREATYRHNWCIKPKEPIYGMSLNNDCDGFDTTPTERICRQCKRHEIVHHKCRLEKVDNEWEYLLSQIPKK